jgi:hypothetical protein
MELGALSRYERPKPSVADYDGLLRASLSFGQTRLRSLEILANLGCCRL